ncbi:DciA family protein [Lysobacter terrae]
MSGWVIRPKSVLDVSKPSVPRRPSGPQAALDALLAEPAGDPIRRAIWLDGLDRQLRPLLPPTLVPHARLANFERGRLVFVVDGPVWRAKLRLAAPELLNAAQSIGLEATELVVKTTLSPSAGATSPPPAIRARPMSKTARDALQAALASLREPDPSDPDDAS